MKTEAIDLLRSLTEAHGAPGSEDGVRTIFQNALSGAAGVTLSTDRSGSAIATLPPSGAGANTVLPRVMVTGHMDEVGFAVQTITKDGFLQFTPLGGWWSHTLISQRVRILTRSGREIIGVIASTPPHFLDEASRNNVIPVEKLFIDVGASGADDVKKHFGIRLGDPIVPLSEFTPMHKPGLFLSKAFDNRVGIAGTIQAVQALARSGDHPNTLLGVATVMEEVGCRGAVTASTACSPDVAIVLEGPPADDTPGFNREESQGLLGRGVQIRTMDPSAIMSRRLVDFVLDTAEKNEIPHQVAVRRSGGTDAKSIHLSGRGVPSVVLGVPARYIHSHNSIIDVHDYLAMVDLTLKLVEAMDAAAVHSFTHFLD